MLDSEELRWTEPNDDPEEGTLVGGSIKPGEADVDFDAGARLGRYVVLSHMGTGGMGVVYAAYDPQLDRRIALKLMHQRGNDDGEAERASRRMLAEAKAMAQLSHPNVITVHDVGTIDGRVFIAMEFVEGVPLSRWMREPGRDWQQILDMFIRAGRGLQAAHAAGLVHRDFKPDNVLVGSDGRVRVLDFGLARRFDGSREPGGDRRDSEAGTPAYMSPEQHLGKALDHRADQFSFCVALYEALYGELPFAAKTRLQLAIAVTDGRVGPAPKRASVPNWVRWALLRGLDPDPDGRWEDMGSLIEALSHDPYHKYRKAAVGGGSALVVLALLAVVIKIGLTRPVVEPAPAPQQCTGAEERVAAVWNEDRVAGVRRAFAEADEPWAAKLGGEVEAGLARWAESWATMHRETCEATAAGEQSDSMLDRRMLCLDRRLAEFDALVDVVSGVEAETLSRAGEAVRKLPDLGACEPGAIEAGLEHPFGQGGGVDPDDAQPDAQRNELERIAVAELERDLFRANSLEMTGAFAEAGKLAAAAVAKARELQDQRLIASALLAEAKVELAQGDPGSAAPLLEEAEFAAERAGADRLRGEILIALARLDAEAGEAEAAARRVREARAVLDRIGADEVRYAALDGVAARASMNVGRFEAAEEQLRAAVKVVAALSPAPVELAELRTSLGVALRELGRYAEAREELEQARALWAEHYGEQHPNIATVRFELALVDDSEGRREDALAGYAAALSVFEQAFGPNSLDVARSTEATAVILGELGRYEESLRRHQQTRAIYRASLNDGETGTAAVALAGALDSEGVIRRELGQLDEALSLHQQALALLERARDSDEPPTAGPRRLDRARVLANLGAALLGLERGAEARAHLDQALELLAANPRDDARPVFAAAGFWAAQAWAAGEQPDLDRARTLAGEARKLFAALEDAEATAEIDAWLEDLGGS